MSETASGPKTKVCPDCAENVKAPARICRYCGYVFELPATPAPSVEPVQPELAAYLAGPVITKQFSSEAPSERRDADKRAMLAAGYLLKGEGGDGQGHYNAYYVRGPNWDSAAAAVACRSNANVPHDTSREAQELRMATNGWTSRLIVRSYASTGRGRALASTEAEILFAHGYRPAGQSAMGSHLNVGRFAGAAYLTGGLSLLFGSSRSQGTIEITFVRE